MFCVLYGPNSLDTRLDQFVAAILKCMNNKIFFYTKNNPIRDIKDVNLLSTSQVQVSCGFGLSLMDHHNVIAHPCGRVGNVTYFFAPEEFQH